MSVRQRRRRGGVYYQTFTNKDFGLLQSLDPSEVTDLYLAAAHFNNAQAPYLLHLNDYPPEHFEDFLMAVARLPMGIRVHLMLGGAGGGLAPLCRDPEACLPLLQRFLVNNPRITGLNLDIEESGILENDVEALVCRLARAYPGYEIAMAPIASCRRPPSPTTTSWKTVDEFDLAVFSATDAARHVRTYCVQMYGDLSPEALNQFLKTYPSIRADQIVAGTISGEFGADPHRMADAYTELLLGWPQVQGIVNWELYDAPQGWAAAAAACPLLFREAYEPLGMMSALCPLF